MTVQKHAEGKTKPNRRELLKGVSIAALGLGASFALPGEWIKPVIRIGVLPAHAQTSGNTITINSFTGSYSGGQYTAAFNASVSLDGGYNVVFFNDSAYSSIIESGVLSSTGGILNFPSLALNASAAGDGLFVTITHLTDTSITASGQATLT